MQKSRSKKLPETLGDLKASPFGDERLRTRSVKDEMRENLLAKLHARERLFPGIIGYDDTVIPQLVNAILSRHHMILLGLRGQAKSRILRSLADLLDEEIPVVRGCEIHDTPFAPICRACRLKLAELEEKTPIAFLPRWRRYVEKLATPDVTIADIIGDVDPIRAARGGLDLSDELTIHYGLLPRANRGLFAINELPDLAGKIQVGLFNIMQEGDVQIKGYPIRLPVDVLLVFSANPEDYTARGKIITPLKDRIGSEIKTHYPLNVQAGMAITAQEAWWLRYAEGRLVIPEFIREVVEQIAFVARESKHIDRRSGVSQRLPITCLENSVSNAERRAVLNQEKVIVPRPADIYAAMPSMTGKLELEYEGEMKGSDQVATGLIKEAIGRVFSRHFVSADCGEVVDWFNAGGMLKLGDAQRAKEALALLHRVPGLVERAAVLKVGEADDSAVTVSACEFILEGLHVQQRIDRNEERGYFKAEERSPERPQREAGARGRRYYN